MRHLGAPTTRSPAFREANPINFGTQLASARHTTNACFAAEVEAEFAAKNVNSVPRLTPVSPFIGDNRTSLDYQLIGAFDP